MFVLFSTAQADCRNINLDRSDYCGSATPLIQMSNVDMPCHPRRTRKDGERRKARAHLGLLFFGSFLRPSFVSPACTLFIHLGPIPGSRSPLQKSEESIAFCRISDSNAGEIELCGFKFVGCGPTFAPLSWTPDSRGENHFGSDKRACLLLARSPSLCVVPLHSCLPKALF